MTKHNETNERLKRKYFTYLNEAQSYSEPSIDIVAKALARFETHTKHRSFGTFHHQQAVAFKRMLAEQPNERGTGKLSKSTVRSTLTALRKFFHWLAGQPGFRSRMNYEDSEYFSPADRDNQIALTQRPRKIPTIEQVTHVIASLPIATVIQRRDRALIAFVLLTGCRDRAVASLQLKHIELTNGVVFQDAREVATKRGKSITTYFFPVGIEASQILAEWIGELRTNHLWGQNDPLFPATLIQHDENAGFHAAGIANRHWRDAGPVRRIFKEAFTTAGLPYFPPHSFRHMLALLGQELCHSAAEMKAWSQNLGHEQMLTTFTSYGRIDPHRQGELIKGLATPDQGLDDVQALFQKLMSARKVR